MKKPKVFRMFTFLSFLINIWLSTENQCRLQLPFGMVVSMFCSYQHNSWENMNLQMVENLQKANFCLHITFMFGKDTITYQFVTSKEELLNLVWKLHQTNFSILSSKCQCLNISYHIVHVTMHSGKAEAMYNSSIIFGPSDIHYFIWNGYNLLSNHKLFVWFVDHKIQSSET